MFISKQRKMPYMEDPLLSLLTLNKIVILCPAWTRITICRPEELYISMKFFQTKQRNTWLQDSDTISLQIWKCKPVTHQTLPRPSTMNFIQFVERSHNNSLFMVWGRYRGTGMRSVPGNPVWGRYRGTGMRSVPGNRYEVGTGEPVPFYFYGIGYFSTLEAMLKFKVVLSKCYSLCAYLG